MAPPLIVAVFWLKVVFVMELEHCLDKVHKILIAPPLIAVLWVKVEFVIEQFDDFNIIAPPYRCSVSPQYVKVELVRFLITVSVASIALAHFFIVKF